MRFGLRVILVLVGLMTLLIGGGMVAARAGVETPPSGRISFWGHDGIYTASASGYNVRKLLPLELTESSGIRDLQWSPDGRWLLFSYLNLVQIERNEREAGHFAHDIYRIRTDASQFQNLTSSPTYAEDSPAWSPDGKWIAFVSDRNSQYDLYLMRPDGSDIRLLVDQFRYQGEPSWSPDSQWIAFIGMTTNETLDIFRVGIDGTSLQQLTSGFYTVSDIAWSPDSAWIFFSGRIDKYEYVSVFRVRSDSSEVQQIISEKTVEWRFDRCSRDSQWITAARTESFTSLYRLRPDGTEAQRIAPEYLGQYRLLMQRGGSWSANGRWIAFEGTAGGYVDGILMTYLPGGEIRRLFHPGWDPVWSPPFDTPFRGAIVIGVGMGLVGAGIAPWRWVGRRRESPV